MKRIIRLFYRDIPDCQQLNDREILWCVKNTIV